MMRLSRLAQEYKQTAMFMFINLGSDVIDFMTTIKCIMYISMGDSLFSLKQYFQAVWENNIIIFIFDFVT